MGHDANEGDAQAGDEEAWNGVDGLVHEDEDSHMTGTDAEYYDSDEEMSA